jgi:antitoxin component YwqK of YwqJK toxin-antitoxin module
VAQSKPVAITGYCTRDSLRSDIQARLEYTVTGKDTVYTSEEYFIDDVKVKKEQYRANQKVHDYWGQTNTVYHLTMLDFDGDKVYEVLKRGPCRCGLWIRYYKNGKMMERGNYYELTDDDLKAMKRKKGDCNSVKNDTWKYYSPGGVLLREENYDKGRLLP